MRLRSGHAPKKKVNRKGATLQHPGWAANHIGFYPFPMSVADEMREQHRPRVLGE
jgi:hypothetical protein